MHDENTDLSTTDYTIQECEHLKIYSESALFDLIPSAVWACAKCNQAGIDNINTVVYLTNAIDGETE